MKDILNVGNGQQMRIYKARNVKMVITPEGESPITLKNFQDGDMGTGDKTDNRITPMADAQGSPAAAVIYSDLGTIQTTVVQGTTSDKLLNRLYKDEIMFSFYIYNTDEVTGGGHCLIQKPAQVQYGKTVPLRAYTVDVFDYDSDANVNS